MKILDNTINIDNAKYWCIFQNSPLTNDLDKYLKQIQKTTTTIEKQLIQSSNDKSTVNEFDGEWTCLDEEFMLLEKPRFRPKAKPKVRPKAKPKVRPKGGPKGGPRRGPKNTKGFFNKMKTGAKAAGYGVKGAVAAGALWVGSKLYDGVIAVKDAIKGVFNFLAGPDGDYSRVKYGALILASSYGLYKVRNYIIPNIKELYNYITTGKCVAKCVFTSGENTYISRFNIGSKKWELVYDDVKLFSKNAIPSSEETNSFFKTQFFKKYSSQCYEYMNKYLNDDTFIELINAVNNDSNVDDDVKNTLTLFIDNRENILNNLKNGSYINI